MKSLGTTYKALDVRKDLEKRINTGVEAATAAFDKWNGSTWTKSRHVLGCLCTEEHRQMTAYLLLAAARCCTEARSGLAMVAAAAGRRGTREEQADAELDAMQARCAASPVSEELRKLLVKRLRDGEIWEVLREYKIVDNNGKILPAVKKELILLATARPQDTKTVPIFSMTDTPILYDKFIKLLFVGFAHNLLVESYVSRVSNIAKFHQGTRPHPAAPSRLPRCHRAPRASLRPPPALTGPVGALAPPPPWA